MNVRQPMLLDANFNEVRRLDPASLSIQTALSPPSVADMTIKMQDETVPIRSWVRLYTVHGDAGIFRVTAADYQYDTEEQRLTLEHGICSLSDTVVPQPEGDADDTELTKTASAMLSWVLAKQPTGAAHWVKGTVEATENVILDQDGSDLFSMLNEIMDQLPEYDLTLDQSSYPWTVGIRQKAQTVTAEGRLSRNLGSVRITYDDSELCTRVYATGLNKHIAQSYMDADTQGTYGIISHCLYLASETKRAEAVRIAERYLYKRKEPAVSVELTAVDLSEATGEPLDAFALGKKFRLALPAYGVTVEQWITGITYSDVFGSPETVTLTLANRIADISQTAAKTKKRAEKADVVASGGGGGGGGGGGARNTAQGVKQNKIVLAVHDEYITAIEDGIDVWRETGASITIEQAMIKLFTSQRDLFGDLNTSTIKEIIRNAGITVDASKSLVEILASATVQQESSIDTNASQITVQAGQISQKVSKNNVISEINQTAETIRISASKINLDGYVTATALEAELADFQYLKSDLVTFTGLVTGSLAVTSGSLSFGSYVASWKNTDVVTNVTYSSDTYSNVALANDSFEVNGRIHSLKVCHSVSKTTATIHYIGRSPT